MSVEAYRPPPSDDPSLWVERHLARMSWDEKLRQLFCLLHQGEGEAELVEMHAFRPGGVMRVPGMDAAAACDIVNALQAESAVPLLIAGDLEGGVLHPAVLGELPSALAVAAADDPTLTFDLYSAAASIARSLGYTWAFGPVLDINTAWRSSIVGTRSYGSNQDRVLAQALAYLRAFQGQGIACAAKHWPGDGQDDRDQHLVTSVNPLSPAQWERSYGELYATLIRAGVMSVMSAHIALPKFGTSDTTLPASVRSELTIDLLRGRLGFEGLVVSDATPMAGVAGVMPRRELLPQLVNAGCDVLLFSPSPESDLAVMRRALECGRLTEARVNQAVERQLRMKASLGLHRGQVPAQSPATQDIERQRDLTSAVVARGSTLVKDSGALLPLQVTKHRRVLVLEQPGNHVVPGVVAPSIEPLVDELRGRGFAVRKHVPGLPVDVQATDLLLYVITQESALTLGHIGIDWTALHGSFPWTMARWWNDVPTVMVSFGHPYLLHDAPQVPAYINAYTAIAPAMRAVAKLMCGQGAFRHDGPVDAISAVDPPAPA